MLRRTDWLDVASGRPTSFERLHDSDLETAVHQGLIGVLAENPGAEVRRVVQPVRARLAAREQIMRRHLYDVLSSLSEAGVRATVLKGPALADWAYHVPRMRTYTDVDLLVPPGDLPKALEALESYPSIRGIPPKRPKADKREIPVVDDVTGISFSLDLHWDLFSYAQLGNTAAHATDWAWDHAEPIVDHALGPMYLLPDETRLAFLATHAALDHRFRLILFRDLAEVAKMGVDWSAVVEFALRWRLRSFVYTSLLLAKRWAGAPVPGEVLRELRVASGPQRAIERLTDRIDPVTFDGHSPHLLNLAFVTLHDSPFHRARLVVRAPSAVPQWWKRVSAEHAVATPRRSALIVLTSNRRRGAEVFGSQLAEGLSSHGWAVQTVSLTSDDSGATVDAEPLVNRKLGDLGRLDPGVVRALRERIKGIRPDVLLANGSATLKYSAAALAGLSPRPSFVYSSIGEPSYWARGRARRLGQRLLLRRTDSIAAVSAETAGQLVAEFGVAESKTTVAHTGVPGRYLEVGRSTRQIDELRIVMVGALTKEKQPQAAVRVLAELQKLHPARLRLVGAGNLEEAVAAEARRLGVDSEVELVGSVRDIGPQLGWADVLLLTSVTEGLPGVVLEAAAAGVPAVAFDVGGTSEAVDHGVTGYVVAPQDVVAAADRLAELTENPGRLVELGTAAREKVRGHFLMSHAIERYAALLDEAAASRRQRARR